MKKLIIISIFPEIFSGFLSTSLIKKAQEKNLVCFDLINLRDFASPPHFHVDDIPYGGGPGMVMLAEPLCKAIDEAKRRLPNAKVILLSAAGELFKQSKAQAFSELEQLILVCGRYEGVDQRVIDLMVDCEVSVGDYVLMGGEVAAMAVIESCLRLVPGVLGNEESIKTESFSSSSLEAPQYTRPARFRELDVPAELLSGNHAQILKWRNEKGLELTKKKRPDLLEQKS